MAPSYTNPVPIYHPSRANHSPPHPEHRDPGPNRVRVENIFGSTNRHGACCETTSSRAFPSTLSGLERLTTSAHTPRLYISLEFFFPYESEEPDVCIDNRLQSRESFVGGAMPMYAESVGPFLPFQMAISTSNSHSEAHSCTLAQATRARALKTMISPRTAGFIPTTPKLKRTAPARIFMNM